MDGPRRQARATGATASRTTQESPPAWQGITLLPSPLPGFARASVNTGLSFLGRAYRLPLLLELSQSAADPAALEVLAGCAARLGALLNAGDLRPALGEATRIEELRAPLERAGAGAVLVELPLSALLAEPLRGGRRDIDAIREAVTALGAGALVVRLDFDEAAIAGEPGIDASNGIEAIADLVRRLPCPVIVRGPVGLPRWTARALVERGVGGLIAGCAEARQVSTPDTTRADTRAFAGWGIPAAGAIRMLRGVGVPVVADGSARSGLDAAKAVALGADLVTSGPAVAHALAAGAEPLDQWVNRFRDELATTMFLVGARSLAGLRQAPFVATGETREWLEAAEMLWRSDAPHP